MTSGALIDKARGLVVRDARVPKFGLFGSYARGDAGVGSSIWERASQEPTGIARTIAREVLWLQQPPGEIGL